MAVDFDAPEEAVSPGQACVLYDTADPGRVLGGGFIAVGVGRPARLASIAMPRHISASLKGTPMSADPVVIVSYARTPMGGFQGSLSGAGATQLGAAAVKAAVERSGAESDAIEQIVMGCVLPAGLGQAPARQAAIGAGLPQSVAGHHGQQDVRLGPAGGDPGA